MIRTHMFELTTSAKRSPPHNAEWTSSCGCIILVDLTAISAQAVLGTGLRLRHGTARRKRVKPRWLRWLDDERALHLKADKLLVRTTLVLHACS